ncbi:ATP-grasp domain-containing protein [Azospirillum halopraeferens]|uniref:ATP-grasp domain-containing protein n=1 Tax=Azospirillum halopraeferens TaxID=34010 RepID=UPI0003FB60F5|nr:RimK family alpha-L-glutamate ligase [Azospirillum halopraeferens]
MARRIVLFAESGDSWHVGRLVRAFRAAGAEPLVVSLQAVEIAVEPGSPGLRIPGLRGGIPDAALVRTVAGGGFEPVTLRLDVLHALVHLGVPVINGPRAIERCVDKAMTSFLLHRAGIPTPATRATADPERAAAILRHALDAGEALVQKPLFGSQGRDVRRLDRGDALTATDGVYYLQRFVAGSGPDFRDWRVFVVGGRAVAAMARIGRDWVTNVHRGGRCEAVHGDRELESLAEAAAAAVGADYAGVDLIRDREGRPYVLEVNSMPAWQGLQSVAAVDVAACVVEHVLGRMAGGGGPGDAVVD